MPIRTQARTCVGDAPRLFLAVAARTVLWSVLLLAVWAALPAVVGWQVTTVASDSMAPGIRAGDVVAAMPVDPEAVTPGRVLLVDDPDHDDRLRLHRLERIEQDGSLRLRGDANAEADRSTVAPSAVHGVGVLRFPGIGLPTVWARSGAVSSVALGAAVAAVLAGLARADRHVVAGQPCRRCGTPRWDLHAPALTPAGAAPPTQRALPVVAALAATTIVLSTMAAAGFSGTTGSASSLRSQTFGCFHHPVGDAALAWDFAEKNGERVHDVSGNGFDGDLALQSPRVDGSCAHNPYVSFEAQSGRAGAVHATKSQPAPGTFSVTTWFRTTNVQGKIVGFGNEPSGGSTSFDRHLYIGADGTLVFGVHDGTARQVVGSTAVVTDGVWHHAVGQFRPGRLELWVDGVLVAERSDVDSAKEYEGYWRAGYDNTINWPNRAPSHYFVGSVDSVRVHDRLLTADEIADAVRTGR